MSFGYGWNQFLVEPQARQDFAWSAPMRDLAARVGLSDVGLKKLLRSHGVAPPPQGYWDKVHAGKRVPACPKVAAPGPGETGRVQLDSRFAHELTAVDPIPSTGPFASKVVPEDLEQLYAQELKAIGRVGVPKTLDRYHPGLAQIFRQEERRRAKFAASGWPWDAPKFDAPGNRRRLRLLNALFMALSRRGHRAEASERDGQIHATALVGNTRVGLEIDRAGTGRGTRTFEGAAPDWPASSPLVFVVDASFDGKQRQSWQDDDAGRLETKLAEITARIIVAGEARFREGLKEAEDRAEQFRRWEEQRRREDIARRNAERLAHLRKSGELLRQAQDLRALIATVREAAVTGSVAADAADLEAWERWASAEADRLDPVKSGQVMAHLAPPDSD